MNRRFFLKSVLVSLIAPTFVVRAIAQCDDVRVVELFKSKEIVLGDGWIVQIERNKVFEYKKFALEDIE